MTYRIKNYIPIASEEVGAGTHTFTSLVHAIRADADGTVEAQLRGDAAFRTYTVSAGDFIFGEFSACKLGAYAAGELLGLVFALE